MSAVSVVLAAVAVRLLHLLLMTMGMWNLSVIGHSLEVCRFLEIGHPFEL